MAKRTRNRRLTISGEESTKASPCTPSRHFVATRRGRNAIVVGQQWGALVRLKQVSGKWRVIPKPLGAARIYVLQLGPVQRIEYRSGRIVLAVGLQPPDLFAQLIAQVADNLARDRVRMRRVGR